MKMKPIILLFLAVGVVFMVSTPLFAHHGSNMYDQVLSTFKGTVTSFEFENPHVVVHFDAKRSDGKVENWFAEGRSPAMMSRAGWNGNTLKAGDQITISGRRNKDGSLRMSIEEVILPNGQKFSTLKEDR